VPWTAIPGCLQELGVQPQVINAIAAFYGPSTPTLLGSTPPIEAEVSKGVCQGCPCSPLIFAAVVHWAVVELRGVPHLVVFADDVVVAHPPAISSNAVLETATRIFWKWGFEVNPSKSEHYAKGATFRHLGPCHRRTAPQAIAPVR